MKTTATVSRLNHIVGWIISLICLTSESKTIAQQVSDDLKRRVAEQMRSCSPDAYAFARTIRSDQSYGGKTEQKITVERFDPVRAGQGRWTLVSLNGAAPGVDALAEFQKDSSKRKVPGYHRLTKYFETPATTSLDSRGRTVFHFAVLPKETVIVMETDVSQNTVADASVVEVDGVPMVEQLHLTVKPMRLKLLMRLDRYELTARYRMGPEGKPLLIEQTSDMTGSGIGKEGRAHTVTTYSDYRAVGAKR